MKRALFLDRDGVINVRLVADYVRNLEQFVLMPGVAEALQQAPRLFDYVFIVTNQQGVGKGLMTKADLEIIHHSLRSQFRIDAVFYCPHLATQYCNCRKPLPGMGLKAKEQFADIDFTQSVMVGDSVSDIEFGKALGLRTVWIGDDSNPAGADQRFESLFKFILHESDHHN